MAGNLKQNPDGSMGIQGADLGEGPFIHATFEWNASSVDKTFFLAHRAMIVKGIIGCPTVIGSDGSAVTAVIRKVPDTIAIGSGTALHSGSLDLKGTAATNQSLTLSTTLATLALAAGDRLAIDFTGTLTAATGVGSVVMCLA